MKRLLLFIIYTLSILTISAQIQKKSSLRGHILDAETEEHLPGVIIKIENTDKAAMSDETGHFVIEDVEAGSYVLISQFLGYKTSRQQIKIDKRSKDISMYLYPEAQLLGEVAIEASARDLNRKISPVVINQLTTKTFEATNSTSLALGLNYMPGLRVENNCQNCGTQEVRINGLQGEYSQILMDGQAIFSSLSQMYGLEQLPTNMIEQVEVVRGGGSVLFGSKAIGGVLNIITKEPEKNSYEAKYTLSMVDGKRADNNLSLNTSFVDRSQTSGISIFGNMRQRNPWDANDDGFSEIGKNESRSIGFRSFAKPSLKDKLTFEYHHISDYRRGGDNINRPPHESLITESTDYSIHSGSLGYSHLTNENKNKLTINGSLQRIGRDSYYGQGGDLNAYGQTSELAASGTVRYEINIDKLIFMPAKLTFGYTQDYANMKDTIHNRRLKQLINVSSLYAQNEWRDDKLTLILGLRAEKHNKLDDINLVPRSSIRYQLNEGMNLRAAYSMGYRAPEVTASDLDIPIIGGNATITVLDNDLKREFSNTINGGMDFTFYNEHIYSYLLLEGFYTKINRVFIQEEMGENENGNTIMMKKNGSGAYVYGINIEGSIQPTTWLDMQGGITFQQSRYTTPVRWSSEDYVAPVRKMLRSPNTYGFMTATATPYKSYAVSLSNVYTGSMLTPHFAGAEGVAKDITVRTKKFIDTTLKVSYFFNINATNKMEVNAGVQNMFDQRQKDYDRGPLRDSEYIYGPTLPRTYFVGIKINSI